jgi:hypothetical protein
VLISTTLPGVLLALAPATSSIRSPALGDDARKVKLKVVRSSAAAIPVIGGTFRHKGRSAIGVFMDSVKKLWEQGLVLDKIGKDVGTVRQRYRLGLSDLSEA